MPMFAVDDEIAALVERLANPRPFENLSFNDALRRILTSQISPAFSGQEAVLGKEPGQDIELEQLLANIRPQVQPMQKKAPSPDPTAWAAMIPELGPTTRLSSWKAICDALKIDTKGDSARRKLADWVAANRPNWPVVPNVEKASVHGKSTP